uniref:phospholipid-transporting ATPase IF isoform X2 n=1 Tax=Myxine glutinosa TaxID=7769 RepID=UPI00358ECF14
MPPTTDRRLADVTVCRNSTCTQKVYNSKPLETAVEQNMSRRSTSSDQVNRRTIYVGRGSMGQPGTAKFPDNTIISSKYTIWNFVPKNLFEQFRRIGNMYFLMIFLVQVIIDSPTSPVTSGLPLFFVITVTAIKQGYEDWRRHKSDNVMNNEPVHVLRDSEVCTEKSRDIQVGDIVRVEQDETFPCDLVLLSSDRRGVCHLTTASLDGETNLKTRCALSQTAHLSSDTLLSSLNAVMECILPEPDLYRFSGSMVVIRDSSLGEGGPVDRSAAQPLEQDSLLLRGASLKNTKFIYGLAVYTGMETKMTLNYKSKTLKRSVVEKSMNKFLLVYLGLLVLMALVSTLMQHFWYGTLHDHTPWYRDMNQSHLGVWKSVKVVTDFLAFMVLFNYIIPVSLYVTVEMQKFLGSRFISWDPALAEPETKEPAMVNTSDLNEELGQVEFVLTDKTGTLTENVMVLKKCSIGGVKYDYEDGELLRSDCMDMTDGPPPNSFKPTSFLDHSLIRAAALCHTVHISQCDEVDGPLDGRQLKRSLPEYYASSPDEKALVEAARGLGVTFLGSDNHQMTLDIKGNEERFEILTILEFDPMRRCMSIILRRPDGEIWVLSKGADSSIMPKVVSGELQKTQKHVDDFALLGLRTLCFGMRRLTQKEFTETEECLRVARTARADRDRLIEEAFASIEQQYHLIGVTAVEDKLQEEVPQTIVQLGLAGIALWVLTGDKRETAVNIGYSCGLFSHDMVIHSFTNDHPDGLRNAELALGLISPSELINGVQDVQATGKRADTPHGLVIEGSCVAKLLSDRPRLQAVCQRVSAVVCCRMSPLQKAEIVRFVKELPGSPITLAVGDGANDVSMIQEAHVGIGLVGKEGRQAARNSDYAIHRFCQLRRLILVHGHLYYVRIAELVQYFFYKNVCFIAPQFLFQFFCSFSQQPLYTTMYLAMYNICFTSLPILVYGLIEQHVPYQLLEHSPHLYTDIANNSSLALPAFLYWTFLGVIHSLIFFFGSYLLFNPDSGLVPSGETHGQWTFGTLVFSVMVITVNLKLALDTRFWTWLNHLVIWGSIAFYIVFSFILGSYLWPMFKRQNMYRVFEHMLIAAPTWFGASLLITLCVLPDIFQHALRRQLYPSATQRAQLEEARYQGARKTKLKMSNGDRRDAESVPLDSIISIARRWDGTAHSCPRV